MPPDLGATACVAPERRIVDPWSYQPLPDGWRCARHDAAPSDEPAPSWLGIGWDAALSHVTVSLDDCSEEDPGDPWLRLASCAYQGALIVCRRDDDASIYVTTMPAESEGCAEHPEIVVLRGGHVIARTGARSRMLDYDRSLLLFGGETQWFVATPQHAAMRFGTVLPDVVRAP